MAVYLKKSKILYFVFVRLSSHPVDSDLYAFTLFLFSISTFHLLLLSSTTGLKPILKVILLYFPKQINAFLKFLIKKKNRI